MNLVLNELKLFGKCNWQDFGLKAGLYLNTLQEIEANNPGSVEACFTKCVASWLRRKDNVDVEGKPTLLRLADIVGEIGDKAAADGIRNKINETGDRATAGGIRNKIKETGDGATAGGIRNKIKETGDRAATDEIRNETKEWKEEAIQKSKKLLCSTFH